MGTVTIPDSNVIYKYEGTVDATTLKINGTAVTATAAELNILDGVTANKNELNILDGCTATADELNILDASANGALMTPGTGISGATGEVVKYSIYRIGDIIYTRILIDITGLHDGGAAGDIIGKDGGTANCHFGQITAAVNGTIWGGDIRCFETPAGGDPDIDVYSAAESTGAQDAAISDLDETQLVDAGDHSAGSIDYFTAAPAADEYLYLVCGDTTDAGRFLITLYGLAS